MIVREFRVDLWTMAPVTGIAEGNLREFRDLGEILRAVRNRFTIVFVDENARTELAEFQHPREAFYVFGRIAHSPTPELARPNDCGVRIDTPAKTGLLWPYQVAPVVLYHRSTQWP
jgi:hypothetical protein